MDTFKFSLTATGTQEIRAKGNFIRYKDVTNGATATTIRVKTDRGDTLVMDPNDKASLPRSFNSLFLTNDDATETVEGRLIIGEGDYDSAQVTGTVTVDALPGKVADNADDQAAVGAGGILAVLARLQAYDGATFDRLRSGADNADAVAAIALGLLLTAARNFGFNGSTWDRLRADNIGGAGAARVTERGFSYGASFSSAAAIAGNTNEQALAPASNTSGVIVWRSGIATAQTSAANTVLGLIAKASAPASAIDGDVLNSAISHAITAVGQVAVVSNVNRPIFVASGKGLYFRNSSATAEGSGYRSVLYTVL